MRFSVRLAAVVSLSVVMALSFAGCERGQGGAEVSGRSGGAPLRGAVISQQRLGSGQLAPCSTGLLDPDVSWPRVVLVSVRDHEAANHLEASSFGASGAELRDHDQEASVRRIRTLRQRKDSLLAALSHLGPSPLVYEYQHFALLALRIDARHLELLRCHPDVTAIHDDQEGVPALSSSLPFIEAPLVHGAGVTGEGTAVAVLDSPIRYWSGYFGDCPDRGDWPPPSDGCALSVWEDVVGETAPETLADRHTHGTHVAGVVRGVAPDVELLSINVFRWADGYGAFYRMSDVIAGLDRVAELASSHDIVAVNLSLGGAWPAPFPCDSLAVIPSSWPESTSGAFPTAYFDPLRTLWVDHGIAVVAAAGNDASQDRLKSPACATLAISVAAMHDGATPRLWAGSNVSRLTDLVAPGVSITAAGFSGDGTSFAAPHVSGAIALLQSGWREERGAFLAPRWVQSRLFLAARPFIHDGVVQRALDVRESEPAFSAAFAFPQLLRAESAGEIPSAPTDLEQTVDVVEDVTIGALFLQLEVIHPQPEDVEVTLTAPSGVSVTLALPAGGPGFNALLGRDVLPEAFEDFSGETTAGSWRLSLSDNGEGGRGFYVSASGFVVESSCEPDCASRTCGDDRCGGSCGECAGDSLCGPDGTCRGCSPSCVGRECGDDGCGGSCGGCDNGLFCDGWEFCRAGNCEPGLSPCQLSDELACTLDCDEDLQACNAPAEGYCLIAGVCIGDGDVEPANPCRECRAAMYAWDWSADDSNACDDGDACTTGDHCEGGVCHGGAPLDCDDGDPCTDDRCEALTGCIHESNSADCDDGDLCTVDDVCSEGSCGGVPRVCDDGDICTLDSCGSDVGCFTEPLDCDDDDACTADFCDSERGCLHEPLDCDDGNPCTDDSCDELTGCLNEPNSVDCDDGNLCTLDDHCEDGACVGTYRDCDDGDACTLDDCGGDLGCLNEPIDCDDHDACTVDSCDSERGCLHEPLDCDDGNPCTDDICEPPEGCLSTANEHPCDDDDSCTVGDVCRDGLCEPGNDECASDGGGCGCAQVGASPMLRGLEALVTSL